MHFASERTACRARCGTREQLEHHQPEAGCARMSKFTMSPRLRSLATRRQFVQSACSPAIQQWSSGVEGVFLKFTFGFYVKLCFDVCETIVVSPATRAPSHADRHADTPTRERTRHTHSNTQTTGWTGWTSFRLSQAKRQQATTSGSYVRILT
jgi:hypothetical protein